MRNEAQCLSACSVYTVNHLQQPTRSFILNSFVCFYLKYKYGCNIQCSKLIPKHLEAIREKKNSSVLCKDEQSFANWALGSSGWASWATLSSDPARLAGLCSSSSPCSASTKQGTSTAQPKPRVVSQYRP